MYKFERETNLVERERERENLEAKARQKRRKREEKELALVLNARLWRERVAFPRKRGERRETEKREESIKNGKKETRGKKGLS